MKARKTGIVAATAVLVVVLLRVCVATPYLIPSVGMENTLYRGEGILVNKWSYGLRLPLMAWWGYHRWGDSPVKREDIVVFNNPGNLSQRAIDHREVFISRCIGIPGDTLLVDSLFAVASSKKNAPDQKLLYTYPNHREKQLDSLMDVLSISSHGVLGKDSTHSIRSFSRYEYYLLEQAIPGRCWVAPAETGDSLQHLCPLVVPGRGMSIRVQPWNKTLLRNTLVLHEGKKAEIKGDSLWVDGKPATFCRFTKDYYWVAANNAANLNDSRLFGFVPEDHIIGKAASIWFSKKEGTGLFDGYRWDRMWTRVK